MSQLILEFCLHRTGDHWRVLTDGTGTRVVIDKLAVDSTVVYGAGDTGVYRLNTAWTLETNFSKHP